MRQAVSLPVYHRFRSFSRHRRGVILALVLGFSLLTLCVSAIQPVAASPAAQQADLSPGSVGPGGFVPVGAQVRAPDQAASAPALAIQPDAVEPWVAVVENEQIFVSQYVSATANWTQRAGILNRGSANPAAQPSLTFAGDNLAVPWAAWREAVDGITLINASLFNGTAWNLTPVLNRNPARSADSPTIAAGALFTGSTPLPWVAWTEEDAGDIPQLVVSRAQADNRAQGGFTWLAVGGSLNLDAARAAVAPDLAFAGPSTTVPWVVWTESGANQADRVFAKRWNGSAWVSVGRQENCADAVACALNSNALQDAGAVRIAAGALPNEATPSPWLIFTEADAQGFEAIHVMRLDPGDPANSSDDRFVPVGGAVNAQCLGNAGVSMAAANNVDVQSAGLRDASDRAAVAATSGGNALTPDLYFVGSVPHIAWVEARSGLATLYVCHLADARAGLERWDLDTLDGVNRTAAAAAAPSLAANATTPYVAWQEALTNTAVFVARRAPAGSAWGANFPARLTGIAGAPALTPAAIDAATAAAPLVRSLSVPLVTAAYHVNGAANIEEVQLQLLARDATTTTVPVLYARYVVSTNLLYLQDPERPGVFFPPATPGASGSNLNTPFVTLEPRKVLITNHGAPSAALDVTWSLIFEDATFFNTYTQAINIVHDGGQATGFFEVGTVYVGHQRYLPVVARE